MKLDKQTTEELKDNGSLLEGEESEAFKLASEEKPEDDSDWNPEFDEDGNLIETDEEDSETEEPYKDDFTPEDEAEEQPLKEKKSLPPAERKIVEMKKELALKEKRIRELEATRQQEETEKQKEDITKSFVEKGYDEKTAKTMTETELRLKQLEESQTELLFLKNNDALLQKYPAAKGNILSIIKNSKATGMTPEQICRGLYGGSPIPEHEQRATRAATGETDDAEEVKDVSNDSRTSILNTGISMTKEERNFIRNLEKTFNTTLKKEEIQRALKNRK